MPVLVGTNCPVPWVGTNGCNRPWLAGTGANGPRGAFGLYICDWPRNDDPGEGLAPGRGLTLADGAFIAASFSNSAEFGSAGGAEDATATAAGGGVGAGGAAGAAGVDGAGDATVGRAGVVGLVLGGRGVHASSSKPLASEEPVRFGATAGLAVAVRAGGVAVRASDSEAAANEAASTLLLLVLFGVGLPRRVLFLSVPSGPEKS